MALRDLIRPVPSWPWTAAKPASSEPAWDAFGHTVLVAFARLRELEREPRKHGGKAGAAQVRDRLEARQRAWKLFDEWMVRRLDGRPDGSGSIASEYVARDSAPRKASIS